MRVDISLLPALAAAFMLVFARIGAMVMLLPGLGESSIPVRIKLGIALVLTLVILPLHRAAYQIDLQSLAPLLVLMVHEIVIGIVLGATARGDAGGAAGRRLGDRPAARPRLRHRGRSDPGPAGHIDRKFSHHPRCDAVVRNRQRSSRHRRAQRQLFDLFAGPADAERRHPRARYPRLRSRLQDRHAAFSAVLGVRPGLQYRARRAGAADAADAGLFRRRAAVDPCRLPRVRPRHHRDDGNLPRLFHRRHARADTAEMKPKKPWPTKTTQRTRQKTPRKNAWMTPTTAATSPRARRSTPGS